MSVGQCDYSLSHSSDGLELVLEVPALLGESVQTIRPQELVLWRLTQHPTRVPGSQPFQTPHQAASGPDEGPCSFPEGQCQVGWGSQGRLHPGGDLGTGPTEEEGSAYMAATASRRQDQCKAGREEAAGRVVGNSLGILGVFGL